MFIITIFRDSRKVEINRNYVSKGVKKSLCIKRLISWYSKICWFPAKKYWWQQNSKFVSRDSYIFWIFFGWGIIVASFIIVGYVWQIFWTETFLLPPIREQPQKIPSWTYRVKGYFTLLVDATKMYLGFNRPNSSLWLSSFIVWKLCNIFILL